MSRLLSTALHLRRDPRFLRLPPYLSFLFIVIGVAWLFLLPLDSYARKNYISENALLPGQVHTYFSGSDQQVFRAYKGEVTALADKDNIEVNDKLEEILKEMRLKVARQNYTYHSSGSEFAGQNTYAILQAPRGDATEAIVLLAPWKNTEGVFNKHGVSLVLTLARYFKRWSLWSKDIIFLFPPDAYAGTQAWVDAYHDSHDPTSIQSLPIKSGALQGAIALDYPQEEKFKAVHILYDGVNGQLPNLDLVNSVVNIAGGQMGFGTSIQHMFQHSNSYADRLRTMFRGMLSQGMGRATGSHSCFMHYHVDAVTLRPYGEGWQDEMAMGRLLEGTCRSLNNLLEHLHQSFFFYLLLAKDRFVSIGTYLPSAMLLAANFTIMALYLWARHGDSSSSKTTVEEKEEKPTPGSPAKVSVASEGSLLLPLGLVVASHALGFVPLYVLNHTPATFLSSTFLAIALVNCALPFLVHGLTKAYCTSSLRQYQLARCFSLLLLGLFLSSLATLNFSLSFLIGLMASPLSFLAPPKSSGGLKWTLACIANLLAPTTLLYTAATVMHADIGRVLQEAAFGWDVSGIYTPIAVWCVWWPAWLVASVAVLGGGQ